MSNDNETRAARELAACPNLSGTAKQRAAKAETEARRLVALVANEDPRQAWGRMTLWLVNNPELLMSVLLDLAARAEPGLSPPEWLVKIGGTAALHPDYHQRKPPPPVPLDEAIARWRDAGLSHIEVARRTGARPAEVAAVLSEPAA